MARESFLLRTDPKILNALRQWAEDELRSSNAQLDFILGVLCEMREDFQQRTTPRKRSLNRQRKPERMNRTWIGFENVARSCPKR